MAVAEQGAIIPLRQVLGVDFIYGFDDGFGATVRALWIVTALGCGLEAFIIIVLGVRSGRAVADDLTGAQTSARRLMGPGWGDLSAIVAAVPAGILTAIGAFLMPLWVLCYALFGLAGAAIGLERRGPFSALARAAGFAFRGGMRATWVRVLGYLAWFILRLGFLAGVLALFSYLPLNQAGQFWVLTCGIVLANTAAYAFLAALDASTLAEGRFRSEGLDIWLSRAEQRGPLTPQSLAVRR